ncbi:MAG: hypothetical protein EB127_03985 [Alphaproteobacteria bacterium]|nr:hypothetical protein [Alphaproteobacteria bacterium]
MVRNVKSITERLEALEKQKNDLIASRRKELLNIIEASGALTIDDKLLVGILLFLRDEKNKNHPVMEEFKAYLGATRVKKSVEVKVDKVDKSEAA